MPLYQKRKTNTEEKETHKDEDKQVSKTFMLTCQFRFI